MIRHSFSCEYCKAKKRSPADHHLSRCPWVSAATYSDLVQTLPKLCSGCLRIKRENHTCPTQFKEGGAASQYFCQQCKRNVKVCKSPSKHQRGHIPGTFVGAAVRLNHEEEEQSSTWAFDSVNKGSLGSSTLLTSVITLLH